MIWVLQDVGLPQPQNAVAELRHVGVLRSIELDSASLALIGRGESFWVRVPVVAIELYDKRGRRNEGVDAEFPGDDVLWDVCDANVVEHRVPDALDPRPFDRLLHGSHLDKTCAEFWIGIAANDGAERHVVLAACCPRRRPKKGFEAHLALVLASVSRSVRVCAPFRAERLTGRFARKLDVAARAVQHQWPFQPHHAAALLGTTALCGPLSSVKQRTAYCARFLGQPGSEALAPQAAVLDDIQACCCHVEVRTAHGTCLHNAGFLFQPRSSRCVGVETALGTEILARNRSARPHPYGFAAVAAWRDHHAEV